MDTLAQIYLSHFGEVYKTQAHTMSKRLPLLLLCPQTISPIYYYFCFTYLCFLFILIENKEKESFYLPTRGRLGLLSLCARNWCFSSSFCLISWWWFSSSFCWWRCYSFCWWRCYSPPVSLVGGGVIPSVSLVGGGGIIVLLCHYLLYR